MERKKRERRELTDDLRRRIVERYQDGEAVEAIAKSLNRYGSVIYGVLNTAGVRLKGSSRAKNGGKRLKLVMARAGRPAAKTANWHGQLAALVNRIRKADSGVTAIEIDLTNGRYTINRATTEHGELA